MIITKTPYRVSLFGGGTDMPAWFEKHGGAVLSFSIDKYCYILCRELPPFFDHKYRLSYSRIETVSEIDKIQHPAIREGIRNYSPERNLEISHQSDLPARSGIGSSSAFAVGLINSLNLLNGKKLSKIQLAREAIKLEQEKIGDLVGSQDQIACSFGGINLIEFSQDKNWEVAPIKLKNREISNFEERMFLVYSGVARTSSKVTSGLLENLESKSKDLESLRDMAYTGREILLNGKDLDQFGELLLEGWRLKRKSNSLASVPKLDEMIFEGLRRGALGAKVLGAGGGGFILFWLRDGDKARFAHDFKLGTYVPVKLDTMGASVLDSSL